MASLEVSHTNVHVRVVYLYATADISSFLVFMILF